MTTILIAIPLFLLAVAGLGLGLVLGRRAPCGSCGDCRDCLMRRNES